MLTLSHYNFINHCKFGRHNKSISNRFVLTQLGDCRKLILLLFVSCFIDMG